MTITKAQLKAKKAELKRLEAFIAKNSVGSAKLKLVVTPCTEYKGYVLVEPQFDNEDFCALFRAKGSKRLSWGANGRGKPRWNKDLGMYRVLGSALKGI